MHRGRADTRMGHGETADEPRIIRTLSSLILFGPRRNPFLSPALSFPRGNHPWFPLANPSGKPLWQTPLATAPGQPSLGKPPWAKTAMAPWHGPSPPV